MDKYEYKVRLQEIKDLIAKGEYVEAASIADTIDWTKVKSVMMLCTISDLYKINRRLEDARDLLLLAYDRYPGGRSIVYSLCELFIKMGDVVQAVEYYKEFVQIAPKDTGRYILQYKLYEAQDVSIEERIEVLKELKSKEYIEKWAYELAYLYHRIGLATKCVEECDELILWFGEGRYVMKAMELKMLHEPLTPSQEEKYAEMKGEIVRQKAAEETGEVYPEAPEEEKPEEEVDESPTKEILMSDPDDIQVKVMNVGQYDTINMQKELAANMKELWDQKTDKEPEAEGDTDLQETKRLDSLADALEDFTMAETKVIETDAVKEALNQSEEQGEVFFGETSEMTPVSAEESSAEITEETLEQPMEAPVQSGQSTVPEAAAPKAEEKQEAEEPQEEEPQPPAQEEPEPPEQESEEEPPAEETPPDTPPQPDETAQAEQPDTSVSVAQTGTAVYTEQLAAGVTVTYDPNGGDSATVSASVTPGQPYGAQPEAVRRGYAFVGWWTLPDDMETRYDKEALKSAMVGLAHLMRGIAPAYLMCSPQDISVVYHVRDPFTGKPTVYLYDGVPGGIGLSDKVYEMDRALLMRARDAAALLEAGGVTVHFAEQYADIPTQAGGLLPLLMDESAVVLLDVGGGDTGAKLIGGYAHLLHAAAVYFVVNPYRPWSGTAAHIGGTLSAVLHASRLRTPRFLLNPNLGRDTTAEEYLDGLVQGLALLTPYVPVEAAAVPAALYAQVRPHTDLPLLRVTPRITIPETGLDE